MFLKHCLYFCPCISFFIFPFPFSLYSSRYRGRAINGYAILNRQGGRSNKCWPATGFESGSPALLSARYPLYQGALPCTRLCDVCIFICVSIYFSRYLSLNMYLYFFSLSDCLRSDRVSGETGRLCWQVQDMINREPFLPPPLLLSQYKLVSDLP